MNFYNWLRSTLRRAWVRFPNRSEALSRARRESRSDNKRLKWEYRCKKCNGWFSQKEVQVDHIIPCGSLTKPEHISSFILNLFCDVSNLQVLCKECHDEKSKSEKAKKGK